jgi:hypothetical protein
MDKIATLSSDKEQLEHLVLRLQVRLIDCLIPVMERFYVILRFPEIVL